MRTRPTTVRAADGSVHALTMSPYEAAALLGLGRSSAYKMVSNDTWPTPITPASSTTHRILTLPQYAGVQWEYHRADNPAAATVPRRERDAAKIPSVLPW